VNNLLSLHTSVGCADIVVGVCVAVVALVVLVDGGGDGGDGRRRRGCLGGKRV
jgi:hypothetical protein